LIAINSHMEINTEDTGLVMGTAGHIDHGKTALVHALTGVDLDRLEEEKRRGITIELGFVSLNLKDGRRIGVVDVPGHERFIKTMVAGAHGVDFVMLVIAADEGVMPQTTEHLDICSLLGVRKGLVALSKCDKVDDETRAMAAEEITELVAGSFLEGAPIIECSAVTGDGIDDLRKAIARVADELPTRSAAGIFRMPVDRSFSLKGFGTVVTGTVTAGRIAKSQEVEILPGPGRATVRDLEIHEKKVESAGPGRRLAINLSGMDRKDVGRGQWVVEAGKIELTRTVDAWVKVLPTPKAPIEHAHEIGFHVGTAFIISEADLLGAAKIPPGGEGPVRLHLKQSLPLVAGDRFVLRSFARKLTVAGGEVVDPHPAGRLAHRGRKGKRIGAEFIREIVSLDVEGRLQRLVDAAALAGVSRAKLHSCLPAPPDEVNTAVENLVKAGKLIEVGGRDELFISRDHFVELREDLARTLEEYHKSHPLEVGPGRAAFRTFRRRRVSDGAFDTALDALIDAGRVITEGDKLRLGSHRPSATGEDREIIEAIVEMLDQSGKTPPTIAEIAKKVGRDKKELASLLKHIVESGRACKVSEELYFHPKIISGIEDALRDYLARHEGIDPVAFKDLVGLSRKFAIPLLEYFDRERVTMRVGNRRVLREGEK